MFSPAVFSAPIFLLRRRNNIHIQKADTMGKVTIRNCNARKFDKNGKRKTPNWEYRFETAPVDGKRRQKTKSGFHTQQSL